MQNFTFKSPTEFIFGKDTHNQAGKYLSQYGAKHVLVHYGRSSAKSSGILDSICESIHAQGITYTLLGGVQPNPLSGLVYDGIKLCRKEKIDFILAVGGGSVIDSAKAIAAGVCYDGDFWDFFCDKAEISECLPVATVLTIPAAGSEGSPNAVITKEEGLFKRGAYFEGFRPVFSIMNPELTFTLPRYQTACGAVDIMAHVLERYFTNTTEVEFTDRLCEAVLKTMLCEVPKALKNPGDYGARANIMWAGMVAHNNLCGVGRQQDWATHNMEHELSAMYNVAHGAGLSVMFPAWMKYVFTHNISRFAQFAVRVMGADMNFENPELTARQGISRFEQFLSQIDMPLSFAEIGAKAEDIPAMAAKIGADAEHPIGNFVPLVTEDIERIYALACTVN